MRSSLLVLAMVVAACDRPDVLIICHNSNCAEPQDPSHDDTVAALHESLALVDDDGAPLIDGTELDLVVHDGRCWFAHDASRVAASIEITEAAAIVADHLRETYDGARFLVELELKATKDVDTSVACALAANDILREAAATRGLELDVMFTSYAPAMLRAVDARRPLDTELARSRLVLGIGIPQPLLDDNRPFAELDGLAIDVAEIHPGWITDTALRVLRSTDVEVGAWFLDMNRETLDGLARLRPTYVLTGQARSFRSWLDG